MDKLVRSLITRGGVVVLVIGAVTLTPPPTGHAQDDSPQARGEDDGDRGRGRDNNRNRDCVPIVEDDNRNSREGDDGDGNGRRGKERCAPSGSSSGIARGDFNGDGFADLAVGVPGEETPTGVPGAGAVTVIYGSANGLTATDPNVPVSQFWSQNATGVPEFSETGDAFGSALAAGNFNGDDFSDLAIGVPNEGVNPFNGGGRVVVIYGSPNGLTATDPTVPPSQSFDSINFFALIPDEGELFGSALAWGDFDEDGVGDLAIGSPGFDGAGAVFILFGSRDAGLSAARRQFWDQNTFGVPGTRQFGSRFGEALAGGDFNGDDSTDLAIGIPFRDVPATGTQGGGTLEDAGEVLVLFGLLDVGLVSTASRIFDETDLFESSIGVGFRSQAGARFGRALATGDFDGNGLDDLAAAAPFRSVGGRTQAGALWVKSGASLSPGPGIPGDVVQFWEQSLIFPGSDQIDEFEGDGSPTEAGDFFGTALAAGDFNADGRLDLAIGVPFEDVLVQRTATSFEIVVDAGAVTVIYGSATGLSITGRAPQFWNQQSINIEDDAEPGDRFGASLTAWNFGRNGTRQLCHPITNVCATFSVPIADLAIGVHRENVGTIVDAGAVNVIYGSISANANGLTFSNDQLWTQASPGVPGAAEANDRFGSAVY